MPWSIAWAVGCKRSADNQAGIWPNLPLTIASKRSAQ